MARNNRSHLAGRSEISDLTPKSLTKQEFGRRLYSLMLEKGWHQSELARRAGLSRDAISVYVRGRAFPTGANLQKLASTLGLAPHELLPNFAETAIREDDPAFEMKVSPGSPNTAWLRVNRLVSIKTAVKVAELLESDDVSDRAGNGR